MRLATFNVENLFERPAAMNFPTWKEGKPYLDDFAKLNELIARPNYTAATKKKLLEIMGRNKGLLTQGKSKFIRLRELRGRLVYKPRGKPREIRYDGADDWVGWFELVPAPVNETAVDNTARIMDLVDADILCVVEADNRIALSRFNKEILKRVGGTPYEHVMLIDGNDQRGIDVGIMTRKNFPIGSMTSHIYDKDTTGVIFSRDCVEYETELSDGSPLLVMVNHFKSKGYGSQSSSDAKRKRQARRARKLYEQRWQEGWDYIAIVGDLNDVPTRDPLGPLFKSGSDLIDIMDHPNFTGDGRPGTYANGTTSNRIDYILMSPALSNRVTAGGVERSGVWGGTHGTLFPHLPEIASPVEAASDHAVLWADIQ